MSDFRITGKSIQDGAQAFKGWVEEGTTRHQEATGALYKETDRTVVRALSKCPDIVTALDVVNNSDKRLALALTSGFLLQQLDGTPNLDNLDVINPLSIPPAFAETLPIKSMKAFPEDSIQIPSTLSLTFNQNHQLISMNPNGVPWVNTTEPYTGKELLRNVDDVRKFYSVSDSKGKPLELSELGAPFLDVTTNPLNDFFTKWNQRLPNNPNHYDPNIDGKIYAQLPKLITITIVDSRVNEETGKTIITPSKRAYILKLKESALNQAPLQGREIIDSAINLAQQGRDTAHPTVPDLHAKALK
jgi:hypothetical protein